MSGRDFDDSQRGQVVKDYVAGQSSSKLSKKYRVCAVTIIRWVREAGEEVRKWHRGDEYSKEVRAEIAAAYLDGQDSHSLAEQYGCSQTMILRILRGEGVKIRDNREAHLLGFSPETVTKAVDLFNGSGSLADVAEFLEVSRTAATRILKEAGVKLRGRSQAARVCGDFRLNESAFDDRNNPDMWYWVGCLLADGCVCYPKGGKTPRIVFELSQTDEDHVRKFREFVGSNAKIQIRPARRNLHLNQPVNSGPAARVQFASSRMAEKLAEYGVLPRKSLTAKAIGYEGSPYERDMWRGAVDGDGSVGVDGRSGYPVVTLTGSSSVCEQFADYARRVFPSYKGVPHRTSTSRKTWLVAVTGYAAFDVLRHLYGDCGVAMTRKKASADAILSRPLLANGGREAVLELVAMGVPVEDITKETGFNEQAIGGVVKKKKREDRNRAIREARDQGKTLLEIAGEFAMSHTNVGHALGKEYKGKKNVRVNRAAQRRARTVELHREGKTVAEMAVILGVGKARVRWDLWHLGIAGEEWNK